MPENKHIEQLTCCGETCWAVDQSGSFYTWGRNCDNELIAISDQVLTSATPKLVPFFEGYKIEKIAPANKDFTFVIATKHHEENRTGLFLCQNDGKHMNIRDSLKDCQLKNNFIFEIIWNINFNQINDMAMASSNSFLYTTKGI